MTARPTQSEPSSSKTRVREAGFRDAPPGPLAARKTGSVGACGLCVPVADEVESARLLANEARDTLHAAGLDDRLIEELADDFVAEDRGDETEEFVGWAKYIAWQRRRSVRAPSLVGADTR